MTPRGLDLTESDLERLSKCGISREIAKGAKLHRASSHEGAEIVGRSGPADYAGILFPYIWPDGDDHIREYRLRRDKPDLEQRADGTFREQGKYISSPGRQNMLYLAPQTAAAWLSDTNLPILITEGEKKTLALFGLGGEGLGDTAELPRWLSVGLSGVWNWRGVIGKAPGPEGGRRDVRGAISDLSRVKWDKRRVLIVFDRDVVTNDKVAIARRMLAKELTRRGALVQDIDIPDAGGVKGIDDLIGTWGPEKVLNLLLEVLDNPKTAKTGAAPNSLVPEIEQHLKRSYHFARDAGGLLYVFEGGVYRPSAENLIKREVKEYCREFNKIWTPELASKLVEYLAADAPELLERPPLDTLNVLNGLLDVTTRTLAAHSPDFLSPVQLPVAFDPEARCPAIDKFCSEVLPDDAQHVIGEIAAWLMLPETSIQKAVLLIGEGANGKSVFLTLLADFLGRENTCSLSLHKIESDKFAAARLVGKLANICPDLPTAALSGTSMFKALTGGDQINAERKYQPSFEFRPFARLVFSANTPPRSDDATHGFFRRWINLPFERRTFNENDAATIPSAILRARLSAPAEVSGLLNRALDSLPQIRTGRLQESESMRNALANFRATTDPLAVWLDRHTVEVPGSVTPKRLIREAYAKDSQDAGRPVVPDNVFTSRLKQLRPHVSTAQRTVNRKVTECFIGIAPRCEGWDTEPAGFASQMPLQEAA